MKFNRILDNRKLFFSQHFIVFYLLRDLLYPDLFNGLEITPYGWNNMGERYGWYVWNHTGDK